MPTFIIIFIIFTAFCLGYLLCAVLACGKITDMWTAIEYSAYKNDNSLCKELLEMRKCLNL